MEDSASDAAFLTIARVMKVQGRVGEVLTELHTDFPERFEQRRTLYAWQPGGERRQLLLEEYWPHKGGMVLKFEGVDSIEEAETLLRSEIQIPASERAELEEGACYVSELLGCLILVDAVVDAVSPGEAVREVGRVVDVNFGAGAAPLLIVKNEDDREFMIPFVESFTRKLDLKGKRIEMQLPEGMLDLDAPLHSAKSGTGKKDRPPAAKS